jgi:hypothetical protein
VLQVIAAPQCDMSVRQAGAIHFKQILIKGWDPKHGESCAARLSTTALRRATCLAPGRGWLCRHQPSRAGYGPVISEWDGGAHIARRRPG